MRAEHLPRRPEATLSTWGATCRPRGPDPSPAMGLPPPGGTRELPEEGITLAQSPANPARQRPRRFVAPQPQRPLKPQGRNRRARPADREDGLKPFPQGKVRIVEQRPRRDRVLVAASQAGIEPPFLPGLPPRLELRDAPPPAARALQAAGPAQALQAPEAFCFRVEPLAEPEKSLFCLHAVRFAGPFMFVKGIKSRPKNVSTGRNILHTPP